MHHTPLTLFVIKRNHAYGSSTHISSGLRNSAMFVVNMLLSEGHRAKLVEAVDGNSIDALVSQNRPTKVVLEAIWVTPTKLAQLQKLWPKVKWTIRVHSATPFLANEGNAVGWIAAFLKQGVEVAFNYEPTADDFSAIGHATYLPNYYPLRKPRLPKPAGKTLDVGCFGAIRPLKNRLVQAFAAVRFAHKHNRKLTFHMNAGRIEQLGSNNLKNIQALFAATGETLKLHPWLEHEEILELIGQMDYCLSVSLSESFCIVASDAVSMGVPLIGSEAISWLPEVSRAETDNSDSIMDAMDRAGHGTVMANSWALKMYLHSAIRIWSRWACD